jgi:hypothetical protein
LVLAILIPQNQILEKECILDIITIIIAAGLEGALGIDKAANVL